MLSAGGWLGARFFFFFFKRERKHGDHHQRTRRAALARKRYGFDKKEKKKGLIPTSVQPKKKKKRPHVPAPAQDAPTAAQPPRGTFQVRLFVLSVDLGSTGGVLCVSGEFGAVLSHTHHSILTARERNWQVFSLPA